MAGIIMVSIIISCEKNPNKPEGFNEKAAFKATSIDIDLLPMASYPITDVQPEVIPPFATGKDRGGNRSCADVAIWKDLQDLCDDCCGTKVDIGDDETGMIAGFGGIEVQIDNEGFVHFDVLETGCKVMAAIIKGSNSANVYWYGPDGTDEDDFLAPPPFDLAELGPDPDPATLKYPWVSNITLCCVCDGKVIAVKVKGDNWACSSVAGEYLGYYPFVVGTQKIYLQGDMDQSVGELIIGDEDDDGNLDVTINNFYMSSFLFNNAYVFIGDVADHNTDYWYYDNIKSSTDPVSQVHFEDDELVIE